MTPVTTCFAIAALKRLHELFMLPDCFFASAKSIPTGFSDAEYAADGSRQYYTSSMVH